MNGSIFKHVKLDEETTFSDFERLLKKIAKNNSLTIEDDCLESLKLTIGTPPKLLEEAMRFFNKNSSISAKDFFIKLLELEVGELIPDQPTSKEIQAHEIGHALGGFLVNFIENLTSVVSMIDANPRKTAGGHVNIECLFNDISNPYAQNKKMLLADLVISIAGGEFESLYTRNGYSQGHARDLYEVDRILLEGVNRNFFGAQYSCSYLVENYENLPESIKTYLSELKGDVVKLLRDVYQNVGSDSFGKMIEKLAQHENMIYGLEANNFFDDTTLLTDYQKGEIEEKVNRFFAKHLQGV